MLSNTQWTDLRSPDSCPRFSMTSSSKDQALMFLLLRKHKKHKQQDLRRLTRRANCECKRFIDTVARRNDDNPLFRQIFRLQAAFEGIPWRTDTETNHTTLDFSSGSEAQLLVKAAATHVSLVNGACFQLSSENTTERQLEPATQHLTSEGKDSRFCLCGFAKLRCISEI